MSPALGMTSWRPRSGGHDENMRGDAAAATEPTSRLLWESCRRDPDPAAVRRALTGGADAALAVAAAAEHRIGPLLWRALGAADARDALGSDGCRARLDGRRAPDGGAASHPACRRPRRSTPDRGGARAAGVQGASRGGPLPRAGAAPDGRHRPAPSRRPITGAPSTPSTRRGGGVVRSGGVEHYDTVLLHEHVPSLSLEVHYGLERASQRVTALDPEALWARRVPLDCAGTPAFGLAQADELVVLAAHAGKPFHGFMRLMWIADLGMIVNGAAARRRAGGLGCACAPRQRRPGASPSSVPRSSWPAASAWMPRRSCSRSRRAAGAVRRCASSSRSHGR